MALRGKDVAAYRWNNIVNGESFSLPPWGAVQFEGGPNASFKGDPEKYYVYKPSNSRPNAPIGFLGPVGIAGNKRGVATMDVPCSARFDKRERPYSGNDLVYVNHDSFELSRVATDPLASFLPVKRLKSIDENFDQIFVASQAAIFPQFTVHQFTPHGFPNGGEVILTYAIPDPEDGDTVKTADVTVPWNCTASQLRDELLGHPSVHSENDLLVQDGPWPLSALWLQFRGSLKNKTIQAPTIYVNGLEGGIFPQILWQRWWVAE